MVHPNSVIPLWINEWRPDFYVALTDKEEWSYTNQALASWTPLFSQLASALNGYRNFNRESEITQFLFKSYGYVVFHLTYGTQGSVIPSMDASLLYDVNGFVDATLSRPVDYYSDLVIDVETYSPRIDADLDAIAAAVAAESSAINSVTAPLHDIVQRAQVDMLFADKEIVGTANKSVMYDLYFNTLNWSSVYLNLNVGTLTLPE